MNNPFPTAMPSLDAYCTVRDVSEDENENCFGNVSKILNHRNRDIFYEDSFHLLSYDRSLSSLDVTVVDEDSLEPTPIRPDGILSVDPQNTACSLSFSMSAPLTKLSALYSLPSHETTTKRDRSSWMGMTSISNIALEPHALAISLERDAESCFIRPPKVARMVSSSPFTPSPLGGYSDRTNILHHISPSSADHRGNSVIATSLVGLVVTGAAASATMNNFSVEAKWSLSGMKTISPNHSKIIKTKDEDEKEGRFRTYQSDQWKERYEELKAYKGEFGHCIVPHNYLHNGSPALV
jgi:hypothetical protein